MQDPPAPGLDGPTMPNPVLSPAADVSTSGGADSRAFEQRALALRAERDALKEKLQQLRAQSVAQAATSSQETAPAADDVPADMQRELVLLRERSKTLIASLRDEQAKAKNAATRAEELASHCKELGDKEQAATAEIASLRQQVAHAEAQATAATPTPAAANATGTDATLSGAELAWVGERIAALRASRDATAAKLQALRLYDVRAGSGGALKGRAAAPLGSGSETTRIKALEAELSETRARLEGVDEERQHLAAEIQRMVDESHGG